MNNYLLNNAEAILGHGGRFESDKWSVTQESSGIATASVLDPAVLESGLALRLFLFILNTAKFK